MNEKASNENERVVVNPVETAVLVVDMQKDFCYEDGALFVGDAVRRIIPNIKALLEDARIKGLPLIFTQDWHSPEDDEFAVWGRHCVEYTRGAELIDELAEVGERAFVVRKTRYTAFFETELEAHLRKKGIKKLIIVGVATNICVLHTAIDASLRGFEIIIPEDCVAALSDYGQEYSLYHIKNVLKGIVTSSDALTFP
ncbi:MAG: cysteine hydrolase [Methanophagales archaeon]|nr:cysteine hydrolase [Methanophagales archaeon]